MDERVFEFCPRLKKIREEIEADLGAAWSLRDAGGIVGLEPKYFSAFFRTRTGMRFRDWLLQERIAKAVGLMERSDDSLTSIAEAVGFADLASFGRAFKRVVRETPRDYRKRFVPWPSSANRADHESKQKIHEAKRTQSRPATVRLRNRIVADDRRE